VDEPLILETNLNELEFKVIGDIVQKFQKRPVDKEKHQKNLNKLGDTPYQFNSIDFKCFEEGFILFQL
jgi:putative protease